MGRNSERWSERRRQKLERWNEQLNDHLPSRLNELRLRIRRSPNGLALGVFSGIAESFRFSVCWTRVIGCIFLLSISGSSGHGNLLVAGFFYLLAAVLMGRPDVSSRRLDASAGSRFEPDDDQAAGGLPVPPPFPSRASRRAAAVPYQQVMRAPRVDFAALDRQLDGLNRRIQRMEGIVTDRHYDWDRRMES